MYSISSWHRISSARITNAFMLWFSSVSLCTRTLIWIAQPLPTEIYRISISNLIWTTPQNSKLPDKTIDYPIRRRRAIIFRRHDGSNFSHQNTQKSTTQTTTTRNSEIKQILDCRAWNLWAVLVATNNTTKPSAAATTTTVTDIQQPHNISIQPQPRWDEESKKIKEEQCLHACRSSAHSRYMLWWCYVYSIQMNSQIQRT